MVKMSPTNTELCREKIITDVKNLGDVVVYKNMAYVVINSNKAGEVGKLKGI